MDLAIRRPTLFQYRFNLMCDADAKPNLQKPNAIMEGWLTVFDSGVIAQGGKRQTLIPFHYSLGLGTLKRVSFDILFRSITLYQEEKKSGCFMGFMAYRRSAGGAFAGGILHLWHCGHLGRLNGCLNELGSNMLHHRGDDRHRIGCPVDRGAILRRIQSGITCLYGCNRSFRIVPCNFIDERHGIGRSGRVRTFRFNEILYGDVYHRLLHCFGSAMVSPDVCNTGFAGSFIKMSDRRRRIIGVGTRCHVYLLDRPDADLLLRPLLSDLLYRTRKCYGRGVSCILGGLLRYEPQYSFHDHKR